MLRQNVNNDVHHEGTKDTKDLGINSLTPNFVLFAIFVVKTQGSTLVAAPPRWALRDLLGENSGAFFAVGKFLA
jgi:hypothetical protein